MSEPCGMCLGIGKVETMQYLDGAQVYMTTDVVVNEAIEKENRHRKQVVVATDCQTCNGSGITPIYLTPEYWQGRLDETNEQLDRSFFGLGRFIRKAIENSSKD